MNMQQIAEHFKSVAGSQDDSLQDEEIPVGHPWFLSVLNGLGAWLATLSFLAFYLLSSSAHLDDWKVPSEILMTATGALLIVMMFLVKPVHEFSRQLRVSFSLAGQVLFVWGIYEWSRDIPVALAAWFVLEILLFFGCKNDFLRFTACWAAIASVVVWLEVSKAPYLFALVAVCAAAFSAIILHEPRWAVGRRSGSYRVLCYALSAALFILLLPSFAFLPQYFYLQGTPEWPSGLALFAVWIYAAAVVMIQSYGLDRLDPRNPSVWAPLLSAVFLAAAMIPAPGVSAGVLVGVLGFYRGMRLLQSMAMLYAAIYLGLYYFDMPWTLWLKSAVLTVIGVICLAAYALLRNNQGMPRHAD